jgi:multidrug resistance protein MdtO
VTLLAFLGRELAPAPGRLRATLRILIGCMVAVTLTITLGGGVMPHGHWTVASIFTVSLPDAGASLRKSLQRIIGTLVGGLLGILAVIVFVDLPVLYAPLIGAVAGFGIFASLTTSAPYVMLLGSLTFALVTFFPPGVEAAFAVETGLWRILAIAIGVACGTGAQLLLWPDDPEAKLREALAARLSSVTAAMRALAIREGGDPPIAAATTPPLAADDLTVQLDLLASAEARHPSLRERHTEQLALIVEVDRLLTTAVWLVGAANSWDGGPDESLRRALLAIALECSRLAEALRAGRPPVDPPPAGLDNLHSGQDVPGLRPTLEDMRLALQRVRGALGFLDPDRPMVTPDLDRPSRTPLLTPAFSMKNTEALALALKAALGVEICYLLMHAWNWPALVTAAVTAVIVGQTSFGATIQKSMLRLGGAILGGVLGSAVIIVTMPNIESVGSLLIVASVGFGIASWIAAGSPRISYVGLQTGLAFAMCVTDPAGPTTDLTTGRDRVLGILIGVLAMLLVHGTLWPARARLTMWSALARTLRSLADLARFAPDARGYRAQLEHAVHYRSAVYQELAATLRVSRESALEPDAEESQLEREQVARLTAHAQAVYLAVLALIRHRVAPGFPTLPEPVQEAMRRLDHGVGETLDALAGRLEGGSAEELPDLAGRFGALETLIPSVGEEPSTHDAAVAVRVAERDHVAIARGLVHEVFVLQDGIYSALAALRRS